MNWFETVKYCGQHPNDPQRDPQRDPNRPYPEDPNPYADDEEPDWKKMLKVEDEPSRAFGTDEGVDMVREDMIYFEESCEEARTEYLRDMQTTTDGPLPPNAQLDCDEFRQFLEDSPELAHIVEQWDRCEETRHTHRRDNT